MRSEALTEVRNERQICFARKAFFHVRAFELNMDLASKEGYLFGGELLYNSAA